MKLTKFFFSQRNRLALVTESLVARSMGRRSRRVRNAVRIDRREDARGSWKGETGAETLFFPCSVSFPVDFFHVI